MITVLLLLTPSIGFTNADAYSGYAYSMGGEFYLPQYGYNYEDIRQACDYWALCGYTSYYTAHPTKSYVTQSRLNSDIIYFSCHGAQHLLDLPNSNLTINESSANTSTVLGLQNITFSNTKLVVYDACETAKTVTGDSGNICKVTITRGADCVLGWYVITSTDSIYWLEHFQNYLALGHTISDSITHADSYIYSDTSLKKHRVYGSSNVALKKSKSSVPEKLDNREKTVSKLLMTYDSISNEILSNEIKKYYPEFNEKNYTFTVTSISEDNTSFVVDIIKTINGNITKSGYTFIFENNTASSFYDNTVKSTINTVPKVVTEKEIEAFKSKSIEEVFQRVSSSKNNNIKILSQEGQTVFDEATGVTTYNVKTTYELIDTGAKGGITNEYAIS